jgi:hypothetical protein
VKHPGSPLPSAEVVGGSVVVGGNSKDVLVGVSLLITTVLGVLSGMLVDVSIDVKSVVVLCDDEVMSEELPSLVVVVADAEDTGIVVPKAASIWDCAYSAAASSSLALSSVLLHCSHVTATIVEVGVLDELVDDDDDDVVVV